MEQWLSFLRGDFRHLDRASQQLTYQSYREFIYRDIYFLLQNHDLTEDVIQESFLKVIASSPKSKKPAKMKAWLKKISRNTAYDYLRKNKNYQYLSHLESMDEEDLFTSAAETAVADQVEEQIRDETLHEALDQLNARYRNVLFRYYVEDKSHRELARELGISEQASAQLLVRARKKLRYYFCKKWVDREEG
ncbi:sigma-70 family RNA polymerase sigma factor [Paenibacillus melissococcoides]|uniref:RNA polymerase sigma factor n=1 Tax=Paenibacillus melissococcoides TaxID=2912268 RepID=A0ABM9FW61_9BACL|nr:MULTISPECIES: sigma-70 family RNA polymerase sigma factor [Paenibacillus]MEB9895933.1 sigma-70 family RNA polymerase sigma factor [Bacillus cereus]CAH8243403.1 sigma-70 family RNA polymerase sigma factor [Paenibacillus melissococcoides]CAH8704410.1 sigma-70 family RNA polymerase sigma factor [Paenibacillus melissococcoides]CAH8707679.1 sigma-70 family RNA polymerase sigma factor [Paenibacillus melissococcoides]GIO80249.1 RNA polymerase sigma factor SigV [Paenibacillus dendritiformis]